jgi:hypothetical protein
MMQRIQVSELKRFARTLEARTLETLAQKRKFTVQVRSAALIFTPLSTGKPRPVNDDQAEQFLELFAERGSFEPMAYHREARNASYLLALIRLYLDRSTH